MKNIGKKQGISLIVLVITIIVIIILATAVILSFIANNPIEKAKEARFKSDMSSFKDSYNLYVLSKIEEQGYNTSLLNADKNSAKYNGGTIEGVSNIFDIIPVLKGSEYEDKIQIQEGILVYDGEEITEEEKRWAQDIGVMLKVKHEIVKHPDQIKTNDIAQGTDGQSANLDLWEYTLQSDNTYSLKYTGEIVDGKIIGTVPERIKKDGSEEFLDVTSLVQAFMGLSELVQAPVIPSTTTRMVYTFVNDFNLTQAPIIPQGVIDMQGTFQSCGELIQGPTIPSSVTNIKYLFSGCQKLVNAPEILANVTDMENTFVNCKKLETVSNIPSTVTDMKNTFSSCTNLRFVPDIPEGVINMEAAFSGCRSLEKAPKIPMGVTNMAKTFTYCTSLVTAPEIPTTVTDMERTFDNCTSLVTAPIIPESVLNLSSTFSLCKSLTGTLTINATPKIYTSCLSNAATNAGTKLKLMGSSTKLDVILNTKSSNSNITL